MPAPKLVSIGVLRPEHYIAVDSAGHVWQGNVRRGQSGKNYIEWKALDSQFPREAH